MDARRRAFALFLLAAAGAGAYLLVVRPLLPHSEADRKAQVAQDAVSLLPVLRRVDASLDDEFRRAWDKRLALYDDDLVADLRGRLETYVDFNVAEHADAAEIWEAGLTPDKVSDAAAEARRRLVEAFGDVGKEMIDESDQGLREEAYKASPKVAGLDPDLPNYRIENERFLATWLPAARARVTELTKRR